MPTTNLATPTARALATTFNRAPGQSPGPPGLTRFRTRFTTIKGNQAAVVTDAAYSSLLVVTTFGEDLTASQSSYTFPAAGTWTPSPNEYVIIGVGSRKIVGPTITPTLTGTGGWNVTWDALDHQETGGSTLAAVTLFAGFVADDVTAGTLTVDYAGTNHAQTGIVVLSGANVDATKTGFPTFVDDSINGSVGIAGFSPNTDQIGFIYVAVSRGTPSAFVPTDATGQATTVTGGVMGITGVWINGTSDHLSHIGDFTSGSSTATILVEVPVTGRGMALGGDRNQLVF